jgi:hypothetical protein
MVDRKATELPNRSLVIDHLRDYGHTSRIVGL